MKYRNQFALGVRLFGVWLITQGTIYAASFIDMKLYPASDRARDSAAASLIYAAFDFGLAAFFLLWTKVIVAWTYGEESSIATEEEAGTEDGTVRDFDERGEEPFGPFLKRGPSPSLFDGVGRIRQFRAA